MSRDIFAKEIRKTGFVLENEIAQILKSAGWSVISNKYYVDDSEEAVREIDLVAYKVGKVQHFDVYTVLIVSCKKSESNAWALLARDINLKDPNADWWPLHAWSNEKSLQFQLSQPGRAKIFHETAQANSVAEALALPTVEVFAFQEMDKTSGRPQNDKPIFSSITSLMKAQAYEIAALPGRKKAPCVYQFNLLSVVDTEVVRLLFKDKSITCHDVDSEHYLARYIVRKKEVFSRIRFIRADAFEKSLQDYGRLHFANCTWFASEYDLFYTDLVKDWRRTQVLEESFKAEIQWFLNWRLESHFQKPTPIGSIGIFWNTTEQQLEVGVEVHDEALLFLNGSEDVKDRIAKALKKIYKFSGSFSFTFDIPF